MRPGLLVLLVAFAVAILFGFIGRAVGSQGLYFFSGVAFLVAIGAGIALIPAVRRLPWPQRMGDLFPKIQRGERLDPIDGHVRSR